MSLHLIDWFEEMQGHIYMKISLFRAFPVKGRGFIEMSETTLGPNFQRLPTSDLNLSQESPLAARVGNTPKCKQHMISFRPQEKISYAPSKVDPIAWSMVHNSI